VADPPEDVEPPNSESGFRAAAHVWRKTSRLVRTADVGADLAKERDRLGRYELRAALGQGGCGTVYQAWDPRHERLVALKLFTRPEGLPADARLLDRFEREVKATARLRHPGIVPLLDSGVEEGQPYLVTELVAGGSLDARIERSGPLAPQEAARLVRDIARAVEYAHSEGVLHRDLKPANVLLTPDGSAQVVDFGLALLEDKDTRLTESGMALGTPAYMPPEQVDARKRVLDARSDVYALGATLHHALSGAPPFDADSVEAVFAALLYQEAEAPGLRQPGVPEDLDTIVLRCLQKEPDARYPTCAALADDLDRVLAGEPILARRLSLFARAVRAARRHPLTLALVLLLGVAVGVAFVEGWLLTRGGGPRVVVPEAR
jgi:serine/threonine protein kinase